MKNIVYHTVNLKIPKNIDTTTVDIIGAGILNLIEGVVNEGYEITDPANVDKSVLTMGDILADKLPYEDDDLFIQQMERVNDKFETIFAANSIMIEEFCGMFDHIKHSTSISVRGLLSLLVNGE